jgi:hypothetical protein
VVNGYLGGDWNPYGEYYLIRNSNAHSWVEAYFGDKGWVTLDATPPDLSVGGRNLFQSMTHFIDFLRMRWYRYVVNFGFGDQYQIFSALSRPTTWFNFDPRGFSISKLQRWLVVKPDWWKALGFLPPAFFLGWMWWRRKKIARRATTRPLSHQATDRYRRLLILFRKKGFRKKPGETPDEFSRVVERNGSRLVKEFTSLYQHARFSKRSNFGDGLQKMDRILSQLQKI